MQLVTDLHSHSKYSRAVSPQMVLPVIAQWCVTKGINVVGTGDFTHPLWIKELESQLDEAGEGLYKLKKWEVGNASGSENEKWGETLKNSPHTSKPTLHILPLFLLTTEVAAIYSQGGKGRRIHLLIFAPNFGAVQKINKELTRRGANLFSDGRPILGMSARDVTRIALEADERCLVIPAHAWTPWFSLYGSMSGFDSIEECFGDLASHIYGIETGLSSDPAMNWRIADLEGRAILSFSDAHSPAKLGRELTVFELPEVSYEMIRKVIVAGPATLPPAPSVAYTIEFYPEEGKYHYTGHRNCGVRHSPEETKKLGVLCPKCRRPLTVGVMHRVEQLARQAKNEELARPLDGITKSDDYGVRWVESADGRPKYTMIVPLLEILSESIHSLVSSQRVLNEYKKLTGEYKNELAVLLGTKPEEIERISGPKIREAIEKVRSGNIVIDPGFDGEFGKVRIWPSDAKAMEGKPEKKERQMEKEQMGLF